MLTNKQAYKHGYAISVKILNYLNYTNTITKYLQTGNIMFQGRRWYLAILGEQNCLIQPAKEATRLKQCETERTNY